jgi:hypothetical protein
MAFKPGVGAASSLLVVPMRAQYGAAWPPVLAPSCLFQPELKVPAPSFRRDLSGRGVMAPVSK